MLTKQSGTAYHHSVIDDVLLMLSQIFAFHILLEIFEEKNRKKWYSRVMPETNNDSIAESEVAEEKKRVEEHMKCKTTYPAEKHRNLNSF